MIAIRYYSNRIFIFVVLVIACDFAQSQHLFLWNWECWLLVCNIIHSDFRFMIAVTSSYKLLRAVTNIFDQ